MNWVKIDLVDKMANFKKLVLHTQSNKTVQT